MDDEVVDRDCTSRWAALRVLGPATPATSLKGLLRACGVDPPGIHDVADVLLAERERLPAPVQVEVDRLAEASRDLRRDRELAFYGAEDLTPSRFYRKADATRAREAARLVVRVVKPAVLGQA